MKTKRQIIKLIAGHTEVDLDGIQLEVLDVENQQ